MFRRIVTLNLFFARSIKKKNAPVVDTQIDDGQQEFPLHTVTSEYHQLKEHFKKIGQDDKNNAGKSPQDNLSYEQFRKMMMSDQKDEQQVPTQKLKLSVIDKLRSMNTPQGLLGKNKTINPSKKGGQSQQQNLKSKNIQEQMSQHQTKDDLQNQLISAILQNNNISEQQMKNMKKNELKMAQQDLLLDQIMKESSLKQLKLGGKYKKNSQQLEITDDQKKLLLRKQKIIEALQKNEDPSQLKYNITKQDLLKMKYSSEIIQKAKQYKNYELGYLKELIITEDTQSESSTIHQRKFINKKDQVKYLSQKKQNVEKYEKKDVVQNSYKNIKGESGLTLYQDQAFYKNKVVKEMKERDKLTKEDIELKRQLQKDLDQGNETSNVFLDQVVFPFDGQLQKKLSYRQTSFGQEEKRIKVMEQKLQKLGIVFNEEQIKNISKQALFQQKHFLQEQQAFQKYLHKKQKKKNMKKELKKIHMNVLKHDVDFDKQVQPSITIKQIKESSNMQMLEQNLQRLQDYDSTKQSVLITQTPDQKQSRIHYIKTLKNMQSFIAMYFANGSFNHNKGQLDDIEILRVIPNRTNTVLNIFWAIQPKYLAQKGIVIGNNSNSQFFEKQKQKLQTRLKNQSKYISSKMTTFLKLRYGPDIRFFYDLKTDKTNEAIQQLSKYIKEIAMDEVEQYRKKGLIKSQKQEIQYFSKMIDVAKSNLHQFNNRKELLSKKYKQMNPEQPKIDNHAKVNGKQVKKRVKKSKGPILQQTIDIKQDTGNVNMSRKKKPSQKLWDTIDLL